MDSTLILEFAEPGGAGHAPWVERVRGQLLAAYRALEAEIQRKPLAVSSDGINQAGISTAVAWQFTQQLLPKVVPAKNYPALSAFSSGAEALPAFVSAPHGDSTYHPVAAKPCAGRFE